MDLSAFVPSQVNALWLAVSGVAGSAIKWGYDSVIAMRRERRSESASVGQQMADMIELLQRELHRANAIRSAYAEDLDRLRAARWSLEDRMEELRDAAIAARSIVHELQRAHGLPETAFPPLPHPVLSSPRAPPQAA